MERILKHLTLNSVFMLLTLGGLLLIGAATLDVRRIALRNAEGIQASREVAAALAKHNEQVMLDFMTRTVDRWDKLSRDNPSLKVPRVTEPILGGHLDDESMRRFAPSNRESGTSGRETGTPESAPPPEGAAPEQKRTPPRS